MGQQVAKEVGPAPLPAGAGYRGGDGVDETRMGIGNHQPDTGQASGDQAPKERGPARAVLGGVQVKAQDLPRLERTRSIREARQASGSHVSPCDKHTHLTHNGFVLTQWGVPNPGRGRILPR